MGSDFYTSADAMHPDTVEALIRRRLDDWRPVPVRPGAVLLFSIFGRAAHMGLVLTASDFVHSLAGQDTTILRLDDPSWSRRIRGSYDTSDAAPV